MQAWMFPRMGPEAAGNDRAVAAASMITVGARTAPHAGSRAGTTMSSSVNQAHPVTDDGDERVRRSRLHTLLAGEPILAAATGGAGMEMPPAQHRGHGGWGVLATTHSIAAQPYAPHYYVNLAQPACARQAR